MKKLLAFLLALMILFSFAACGKADAPETTAGTADGEKLQFTVIVVHKDQTEEIFLYEATPGKLGVVLEAKGLIASEGADDGMFHTVDGEKADWNTDQSYWAFYVENEYAMKGIYETDIENGRTYKLVYTIG